MLACLRAVGNTSQPGGPARAGTDDAARRDGFAVRLVMAVVGLGAIGVAVAYVLSRIPIWPWALLEHFRLQFAVGGSVVMALAAALRMAGYFDVAAVATILQVLPLTADVCQSPAALPVDGVALRVLVLNVETENDRFDLVRQLIAAEDPDVVGLVEVDRRWLAGVAPAVAGYPGRIESPRDDNFGVALYARGELRGAAEIVGGELPTVFAELALRGARLRVILTHPPPPVSRGVLAMQYAQLAALARRVPGPEPVILMGDLNATPWSQPLRWLHDHTGLCDSRAGFGMQLSWNARAPAQLLRIPIDHLLASCTIGVADRRIGSAVGSDHLPVLLDLVVPRAP